MSEVAQDSKPTIEANIPWKPYIPLILIAIGLFIAFTIYQFIDKLEDLRPPEKFYTEPLPAFTGTDHEGEPFSVEDMKGKVWVASFVFTRCSGTCPMMGQRMVDLQKALITNFGKDQLARVRLVSFTVDTEHDTVPILKSYAKMFFAREGFWRYVTSEPGEVQKLAVEGFKLSTSEAEGAEAQEAFIHSSKLCLVDTKGYVRGYFEGATDMNDSKAAKEVVKKLYSQIRILLTEK